MEISLFLVCDFQDGKYNTKFVFFSIRDHVDLWEPLDPLESLAEG